MKEELESYSTCRDVMVEGNAVKLFSCSARDVRLTRPPIVSGSILKAFPFNVSFSNLPASQTLQLSKAYSLAQRAPLRCSTQAKAILMRQMSPPFCIFDAMWTY